MTIDEAANLLSQYKRGAGVLDEDLGKAYAVAIASLKAWEKVYNEICDNAGKLIKTDKHDAICMATGLQSARCIVGKYLQEIEK